VSALPSAECIISLVKAAVASSIESSADQSSRCKQPCVAGRECTTWPYARDDLRRRGDQSVSARLTPALLVKKYLQVPVRFGLKDSSRANDLREGAGGVGRIVGLPISEYPSNSPPAEDHTPHWPSRISSRRVSVVSVYPTNLRWGKSRTELGSDRCQRRSAAAPPVR
jgi:hypothetical protein